MAAAPTVGYEYSTVWRTLPRVASNVLGAIVLLFAFFAFMDEEEPSFLWVAVSADSW